MNQLHRAQLRYAAPAAPSYRRSCCLRRPLAARAGIPTPLISSGDLDLPDRKGIVRGGLIAAPVSLAIWGAMIFGALHFF
jgi:hypothetical protein